MNNKIATSIICFAIGILISQVLIVPHLKAKPTTMWGEDFVKKYPQAGLTKFMFAMAQVTGPAPDYKPIIKYEFGLRSDGVVVWREIK